MKPKEILLCCGVILFAWCAYATEQTDAEAARSGAVSAKTIREFGTVFVLSSSHHTDAVQTEEYLVEGESPDNWTQMLTYQRVAFEQPVGADRFVAVLLSHFSSRPNPPRVRVLEQNTTAAVLGIHYPQTVAMPEQFGIALITVPDLGRPSQVHLIAYVANPKRLDLPTLEANVRRWQSRFQSQAVCVAKR
jgi:hypothetical protein